jgi:anti-sigma B factor antagonist
MDLRLRRDAERLVGEIAGRVDEDSWRDFSAQLNVAVREAVGAGLPLVLDLTELEFMTSKGLRALTMAKKEAAGAVTITLAAPNLTMRRILSISRYDMLFPVVDHVDPAG